LRTASSTKYAVFLVLEITCPQESRDNNNRKAVTPPLSSA
jgi:hypothetical protein